MPSAGKLFKSKNYLSSPHSLSSSSPSQSPKSLVIMILDKTGVVVRVSIESIQSDETYIIYREPSL